jgi:uracil-DNA glycosylase family 4
LQQARASGSLSVMSRAPLFDLHCRRCPRLASYLDEVKAQYPDYHARPVPSFGPSPARLLIVGLAPGMHGANRTGRPFTGDHAGQLLYQILHELNLGSGAKSVHRRDGLKLRHCRITNAVKCVPPQNKPVGAEVRNCNGFLGAELAAMAPGGVIFALGGVAHGAVLKALALKPKNFPFGHGNEHRLGDGRWLVDSYHCSRYNTQTRRLTTPMFRQVMRRASTLAKIPPERG